MSCHHAFCTCCHDAYIEGLLDGYKVGFARGYKAGYLSGFVDATLHLTPPVAYQPAIKERLKPYLLPEAQATVLASLRKACGCFIVCTCGQA